ncbi:hypothetical protein DOY81_004181, partial [Sarcophaga bullata]
FKMKSLADWYYDEIFIGRTKGWPPQLVKKTERRKNKFFGVGKPTIASELWLPLTLSLCRFYCFQRCCINNVDTTRGLHSFNVLIEQHMWPAICK